MEEVYLGKMNLSNFEKSNMEEISFKVILRGKELDKAEEYLYSIKNAIQEDIVEQNCEFEDFDVLITE